jgi:hypothetical protein
MTTTALMPTPPEDQRSDQEALLLRVLELNNLARQRYYRGETTALEVIQWPLP